MARCWCIAGVVGLLGCSAPTEIVVVVDSDLLPGTELTEVEVVASVGAAQAQGRRFDVERAGLPLSLSIAPATDTELPVRIAASGFAPGGETIVSQTAVLPFVSGRSIRLDLPLARVCAFQEELCPEDTETCSAGACVAQARDPEMLPEAGDGDPPRLFEGPSMADGGTDGGTDAGPNVDRDGGVDAGPACVSGEACTVPRSCMTGGMRCDPEPTCEPTGMLPAGTSCGEGRMCDSEGRCGAG